MALKDRRACPPCCKNPTECDHCGEKCIPRYLCVNATITGPYGECHCDSIDMRIFPTSGCGWSGEVYCGEDSLTVTVTLETLRGTCFTHVVVPEIELDTMFEGVIQDVAFTGTDYNGVEYDVTITPAQMVENPLAYGNCPICSCATCLPAAFCVFFTDLYGEIYSATLNWDCTSRQYPVVEVTDGMSVEILLGTDTCKLTVNATGGSVDINLESSEPDPTDGGIICLESAGYVTKGTSPFASIEQPGIIAATISVPTGTVRVVEKSCNGTCTACAPSRSCSCSSFVDTSDSLTLSATDGSGSVTLSRPSPLDNFLEYKGTGWGDFFTITIACDPDGHPGQLGLMVLHEPGSACVTRIDTYWIDTQECSPLEAHFTGVDFCPTVVDLVVTL